MDDKVTSLRRRTFMRFVKAKDENVDNPVMEKNIGKGLENNDGCNDAKKFYEELFGEKNPRGELFPTFLESSSTSSSSSSTLTSSSTSPSIVQLLDRWCGKKHETIVSFEISNENKGYQILSEKLGWKFSGLGAKEQGILYPIPSILKLDRSGIGGKSHKTLRPKITHFKSLEFDPKTGKETEESKLERIRDQMEMRNKRKKLLDRRGVILKKKVVCERIRREKRKEAKIRDMILGANEFSYC